jgi:hypothetical protein
MRYRWLLALALLVPAAASAASFPQQSLFLSRSPVTEGEVVLIHTVVSNDAVSTFSGTLVLKDEDAKIGSVPLTLKSGEAQTASVSWKPLTPGSHTVAAELQTKDGTVVEKTSATFSIKEKPKPVTPVAAASSAQNAAVGSSQDIQHSIGSVSPQVESALSPGFEFIDGARDKAADMLDAQLASAKPHIDKKPGTVEGSQTQLPDTAGGFMYALWLMWFYILTMLRFIIGNAGVFYPVAAAAFLYLLWRTFKRFRRA